jgi:hypothetical protein
LHNTSNPESTLKKKSNSIAYHLVREFIAMDEMCAGYINTDENNVDLMTKICQWENAGKGSYVGLCGTSIPKQKTYSWVVGRNPNEGLPGSRIRKEGSNILLIASKVAVSISDYVSELASLRGLNGSLGIGLSRKFHTMCKISSKF